MVQMMVTTVLLRGKRRVSSFLEMPWVRLLGYGGMYAGGGFLLSGASLWGQMQPLALGMILNLAGWPCLLAALGSGLGYRAFWGASGWQGAVWAAGGLILSLTLPFFSGAVHRRERTAASAACLVSAVGLAFQYRFRESIPFPHFLLRILTGAASAVLGEYMLTGKSRICRWSAVALGVLALSNIRSPTWCNPGLLAAGAAIAAVPLPGALIIGFGAELSGAVQLPLLAGTGMAFFVQQLRIPFRRELAPLLGCTGAMLLSGRWDAGGLLAIGLGGIAGASIPWQVTAVPRRSGLAGAQVQLEQASRIMNRMERQLLEYYPPEIKTTELTDQLRQECCGECPARQSCREQEGLTARVLEGDAAFPCRKADTAAARIREFRDRLKRMKQFRAMQVEYRSAMAQQYGFLSEMLSELSDRLPEHIYRGRIKYRVQISSRSRSKAYADGDRVLAFPGAYCRYYVVLCDGMGTGLGAAEEGRQASQLLKQMLSAGISPSGALGGLNSQLTLLGRGGAVAVDLAELRLDSGTVWIYKWGASPSWLLGHGRAEQVGHGSAPPGRDVAADREQISRLSLGHGQVLVMISDGVAGEQAALWAQDVGGEPGILAQRIVAESGSSRDDATAVVIRMVEIEE